MIKKLTIFTLLFAFVFYSFPISAFAYYTSGFSLYQNCSDHFPVQETWFAIAPHSNKELGEIFEEGAKENYWHGWIYAINPLSIDMSSDNSTYLVYESRAFCRNYDGDGEYQIESKDLVYEVKKQDSDKVSLTTYLNYKYTYTPDYNNSSTSYFEKSDSAILPLNDKIIATSVPQCVSDSISHTFYTVAWVNCTTYGLSADGRIGEAHYYQEDKKIGGTFVKALANIISSVLGAVFPIFGTFMGAVVGVTANQINSAAVNIISGPSTLEATVKQSLLDTIGGGGNLGVGKWEWTEQFTTSPTSEPVEEPTTELEPSLDFRGPVTVSPSQDIKLSWTTENVDSCEALGDWSGNKQTGGLPYKTENIEQTGLDNYTFILSCDGPNGSISKTVNTKVVKTLRCSFSANPISIISPQESTLSWNCSYANSCSIDQRIGKVDNIFGSIKVSPTSTTVYKLSCQGEDDSEEYKATVNVGFIPIIKEVAPY